MIEQVNYKQYYFPLKEIVLAHFQSLFGKVIVMYSEKMKAKYMKEDVRKSFFRKLAGWHLATSLYNMLEKHL